MGANLKERNIKGREEKGEISVEERVKYSDIRMKRPNPYAGDDRDIRVVEWRDFFYTVSSNLPLGSFKLFYTIKVTNFYTKYSIKLIAVLPKQYIYKYIYCIYTEISAALISGISQC